MKKLVIFSVMMMLLLSTAASASFFDFITGYQLIDGSSLIDRIFGSVEEDTSVTGLPDNSIENTGSSGDSVFLLPARELVDIPWEIYTSIDGCADTDGGQDYYTYGKIYVSADGGVDEFADYCYDDDLLVEYYCYEGVPAIDDQYCVKGCYGGVCLSDIGSIAELQERVIEYSSCVDMDGDQALPQISSTYVELEDGTRYFDSCIDDDLLLEMGCDEDNNVADTIFACSSLPAGIDQNYFCYDGACAYCVDTDNGAYPDIPGTVYASDEDNGGILEIKQDECLNSDHIREFKCMNGELASNTLSCSSLGMECYSGGDNPAECIVPGSRYCSDSDGGNAHHIFGIVETEEGVVHSDYCNYQDDMRVYLVEGLCDEGLVQNNVNCLSVYNEVCDMEEGVCTPCYDSDAEENSDGIYEQGVVYTYSTSVGSSRLQTDYDYCSDAWTLQEYICLAGTNTHAAIDCEDGCSDGACIKEYVIDTERPSFNFFA